jgi:hypothetical protein
MRVLLAAVATLVVACGAAAPGPKAETNAACPFGDGTVVTYNPNGYDQLFRAFKRHATPCLQYYVTIPPAGDKTQARLFREGTKTRVADYIHSGGSNFHAVAEFNWSAWSKKKKLSWFRRGQLFRRQADRYGYDTWAVNEFPSAVRSAPAKRAAAEAVVRGLYAGPGSVRKQGIVFITGFAQDTPLAQMGTYKANLESLTADAAFWGVMNTTVRFWGQETYADCHVSCVPGMKPRDRATPLNQYLQHPVRLAVAGGATGSAAANYYFGHYFSMTTASWKSDLYGHTNISKDAMRGLVSLETYAVRRYATGNRWPGGRIGFSWNDASAAPPATKRQFDLVADRLGVALAAAYSPGSAPPAACAGGGKAGPWYWCSRNVAGARTNTAWTTFDHW